MPRPKFADDQVWDWFESGSNQPCPKCGRPLDTHRKNFLVPGGIQNLGGGACAEIPQIKKPPMPGGGIQNPDGSACAETPQMKNPPTAKGCTRGCTTAILVVVGALIVLVILGYIISGLSYGTWNMNQWPTAVPEPTAIPGLCDEDCLDKHHTDAEVLCPPHIERRAQYAHRWTDGFMEMKFSRGASRPEGAAWYTGDRLQFQNGFGAWRNMWYSCLIDTQTDSVISVTVMER